MTVPNDHDLLITLQAQLAATNDLVKKVDEVSRKFDALRDEHLNHAERIRSLERGSQNFDFRIASLEAKVDALQDDGEQREAVQKALLEAGKRRDEEHEKAMRAWAFAFGAISFIAAMLPQIAVFLQKVLAP